MVFTRKCTKCGKELPLTPDYFYRNITASYGFYYACKDCCKSANRKKRIANIKRRGKAKEKLNDAIPQKSKVLNENITPIENPVNEYQKFLNSLI